MGMTKVLTTVACLGLFAAVGGTGVTAPTVKAQDKEDTKSSFQQAQKDFESSDSKLAKQIAKASSASLKARLAGQFAEFESIDQRLMELLLSRKQARRKFLSLRSTFLLQAQTEDSKNELRSISEERQKLAAEITSLERSRYRRWPPSEAESQIAASLKDNKSRERIAAALAGKTEPIQGGDSLKSVLDFISEVHGFTIITDRGQLEDAQIESLEDITVCEDVSLSGIRLASAINIVLEQLEGTDEPLGYFVENEVLKITTRHAADEHLEDHVYSLALTTADPNPEQLLEVLHELTIGGDDAIPTSIHFLGNKLVVRHNQRGHRKVLELLTKLGINLATDKPIAKKPTPAQPE